MNPKKSKSSWEESLAKKDFPLSGKLEERIREFGQNPDQQPSHNTPAETKITAFPWWKTAAGLAAAVLLLLVIFPRQTSSPNRSTPLAQGNAPEATAPTEVAVSEWEELFAMEEALSFSLDLAEPETVESLDWLTNS